MEILIEALPYIFGLIVEVLFLTILIKNDK